MSTALLRKPDSFDAVIIGGGAAGFFAAISAIKEQPAWNILILEALQEPLSKVRISGGGRCNVTHSCFDPKELVKAYPRGGRELLSAFTRFQPQDTVDWFEAQGVVLKTEDDGRIFPESDNSETIIEALTRPIDGNHLQLKTSSAVQTIHHEKDQFKIITNDGSTLTSPRVVLATGGSKHGYDLAASLGHTITPLIPSLFTFKIADSRIERLQGITIPSCSVQVFSLKQEGPVLITHWGLSGPAILKLSSFGARELQAHHYKAPLMINWVAPLKQDACRTRLREIRELYPKKQASRHAQFEIPLRLWERLTGAAGLNGKQLWSETSNAHIDQLVSQLTQGTFQIEGKGAFKEEFVTCGGVALNEVNFKTMESKKVPGLYLVGEILDIDGLTGGFNLQNSWTTGWIAGQSLGKTP